MRDEDFGLLGRASAELAAMVRGAAPALAALRIVPGGHVTAFAWRPGLLVTSAPAVRAAREVMVVLPGGHLVLPRRADVLEQSGIATLRLPGLGGVTLPGGETPPAVGALGLALGAALDGAPTAQLMMLRSAGTDMLLDGSADPSAEGGPILDMAGRLMGMALRSMNGAWMLLPSAEIARALGARCRGWLGVAFQPTLVPGRLRAKAGQDSARMVVRVAPGGPADAAGLRAGDIVLALDGLSMSGPGALRGFLAARAGSEVEARVVRDGRIARLALVVGAEPGGM